MVEVSTGQAGSGLIEVIGQAGSGLVEVPEEKVGRSDTGQVGSGLFGYYINRPVQGWRHRDMLI